MSEIIQVVALISGIVVAIFLLRHIVKAASSSVIFTERQKQRFQEVYRQIRTETSNTDYSPEVWAIINAAAENSLTDLDWLALRVPKTLMYIIHIEQREFAKKGASRNDE